MRKWKILRVIYSMSFGYVNGDNQLYTCMEIVNLQYRFCDKIRSATPDFTTKSEVLLWIFTVFIHCLSQKNPVFTVETN